MHVKISMRTLDRHSLSEHEARRCRATARSRHWEVWEESILWWSPDREHWQPLENDVMPRARRWLMVETEDGMTVALLWDAADAFVLPSQEGDSGTAPQRPRRYTPLGLNSGLQEDAVVD